MSGFRREAESTANSDDESLRVLGAGKSARAHLHAEFRSVRAVGSDRLTGERYAESRVDRYGLALAAIVTAGWRSAQDTGCVLRHERTKARRPSGPRGVHAP
jgi:hypothetical protein